MYTRARVSNVQFLGGGLQSGMTPFACPKQSFHPEKRPISSPKTAFLPPRPVSILLTNGK